MKRIEVTKWLVNVRLLRGVIVFLVCVACVVYAVKEKERKIRVKAEQELTQTLQEKKELEQHWLTAVQEKEMLQEGLKAEQDRSKVLAERVTEQEQQIQRTQDNLEKETALRQNTEGQLIVVLQEKRALQAKVQELLGPAAAVQLEKVVVKAAPPVAGRVLAVDKQRNFIVVNLGREHNLQLGDTLSVYRQGQFLGRVAVERITTNVSAAGILPEWEGVEFKIDDEVQGI